METIKDLLYYLRKEKILGNRWWFCQKNLNGKLPESHWTLKNYKQLFQEF